MSSHNLKLNPGYFEVKLAGRKPWEIRATDDRFFAEGDVVTFREFLPASLEYTGREYGPCRITYILHGTGSTLVPPGTCIFTHTEAGR